MPCESHGKMQETGAPGRIKLRTRMSLKLRYKLRPMGTSSTRRICPLYARSGRIRHCRECHPRAACLAQHCGQREYLNDDLHIVTLTKDLLASPPVDLWPEVVRRLTVPMDVDEYCSPSWRSTADRVKWPTSGQIGHVLALRKEDYRQE